MTDDGWRKFIFIFVFFSVSFIFCYFPFWQSNDTIRSASYLPEEIEREREWMIYWKFFILSEHLLLRSVYCGGVDSFILLRKVQCVCFKWNEFISHFITRCLDIWTVANEGSFFDYTKIAFVFISLFWNEFHWWSSTILHIAYSKSHFNEPIKSIQYLVHNLSFKSLKTDSIY